MRRWRTLVAVVGLLWLAACKSDGDPGPEVAGATVPTAAPTTTTTNPDAVPQVIDAAYVNRVLAGLDGVHGDAFRLMVRTRSLPNEAVDRLKAIYAERDFLNLQLRIFQESILPNPSQVPAVPGDRRTVVAQLMTSSQRCIYATVSRNYSEFSGRTSAARQEWIALAPHDALSDPSGYNKTGWAIDL